MFTVLPLLSSMLHMYMIIPLCLQAHLNPAQRERQQALEKVSNAHRQHSRTPSATDQGALGLGLHHQQHQQQQPIGSSPPPPYSRRQSLDRRDSSSSASNFASGRDYDRRDSSEQQRYSGGNNSGGGASLPFSHHQRTDSSSSIMSAASGRGGYGRSGSSSSMDTHLLEPSQQKLKPSGNLSFPWHHRITMLRFSQCAEADPASQVYAEDLPQTGLSSINGLQHT